LPAKSIGSIAAITEFGACVIVQGPPGGGWLLLTATQSVLSITLIALFLLAIRWRFRRDRFPHVA
jgi:hypothetical protein